MMNFTSSFKHFLFFKLLHLCLILCGLSTQAATLEVSTTTINIGCKQSFPTFTITSDVSWTISAPTWVAQLDYSSSNSTSGSGNKTILVNVMPNTTTSSRTGTITISGTGVSSKTITITQAGVTADGFEPNDSETAASPINLVFNSDIAVVSIDGSTIHSAADIDYYKLSLPTGYSYNITSTLFDSFNSDGEIYYSIDAIYSYDIVTGTTGVMSATADSKLPDFTNTGGSNIYFKVQPKTTGNFGAYKLKLTITRAIGTPTLAVSSDNIKLNTAAYATSTFTITSNTNWSVNNAGSWWLTASPSSGSGNGTVTVVTNANTGIDDLKGLLTLTANGTASKVVTVTKLGIDLAPDSYEANETEATAKELPMVLTNNSANITTIGAQISTSTDVDYYKIMLPALAAGSSYAIAASIHDYDELYYPYVNAKIYYKIGSAGTWSAKYDKKIPNLSYTGGDYVYFKIQADTIVLKGLYSLDISINQNTTTPTLAVSTTNVNVTSPNDKSTATFTITSNSGWRINTVPGVFYTCSPTSGWGNATITVTCAAYTTSCNSCSRSSNAAEITCPGATSISVWISQSGIIGGGKYVADSYETNETEATAKKLDVSFTDNKANVKTTDANIHTSTDLDFYKVVLPAGYTYKISSRLRDVKYQDKADIFTLNAQYAVKKGVSGTWSNNADEYSSDILFSGSDSVYFEVQPLNTGITGSYMLDITITRALGSVSLDVSPNSIDLSSAVSSTADFTITSGGTNWTVTSDAPWLTSSMATGTGNSTVKLTATANVSEVERSATINISANGFITKEISVTQPGKDLSPDFYEENNSEDKAYTANIAFNNNIACFSTIGANHHNANDYDYYKINFPIGYDYTISTIINEFSGNASFSYKIGSTGSWVSFSGNIYPNFIVNGGNDVFFSVRPGYLNGTYEMVESIVRTPASLVVSETTLNIAATASTATFNITSNVNWTVASSETWLTASAASGSNNGTITLTATANTATSARGATVTITGSGITKTITVIQTTTASASLTVSTTALNVGAVADSKATFDITSNIGWTVSSSETWLTASNPSGYNNVTVTLTTTVNPTITARTATVTISGSGITKTITVTQAASEPALSVSAAIIAVDIAAASAATFNINSNTSWTATSSDTWLTLNNVSGTGNAIITITTASATASARTATVTITGSGITKTITVTQVVPVLTVSSSALNVNATAASTATFNITSNTGYTITSSETWLTVNSASGSSNATITVTATANTSVSARTATVTIAGSRITKTVTIIQLGKSTGIDNVSVTGIKIYPNPVTDIAILELEEQSIQNQILIYSAKGELITNEVYKTNRFEIDMATYKAGVYFMKIITPGGAKTLKVIKN